MLPKITGAKVDRLRARMTEGGFTLRGPVAALAERGLRVNDRTMGVFAQAEGFSFRESRARQ